MKPADYAVIGGKGVNILVTQDEGDPAYYEAKLMFCAPKDFPATELAEALLQKVEHFLRGGRLANEM